MSWTSRTAQSREGVLMACAWYFIFLLSYMENRSNKKLLVIKQSETDISDPLSFICSWLSKSDPNCDMFLIIQIRFLIIQIVTSSLPKSAHTVCGEANGAQNARAPEYSACSRSDFELDLALFWHDSGKRNESKSSIGVYACVHTWKQIYLTRRAGRGCLQCCLICWGP